MSDSIDFTPGGNRSDTMHFLLRGDPNRQVIHEVSCVTWVGVAVNVALTAVKTVGGILGSSSVLLADAVHTVSDLATDAAILIGVRYWSAPADAEHPHGHRKIETMITLAIGVALAAVGVGMGWNSAEKLIRVAAGQPPVVQAMGVSWYLGLGAALSSIVGKEILYRWTVWKGIRLGSSALLANAWHHRSDAFSSIPAVLAIAGQGLGAHFGRDLWYLDPLGTLVVCVMLVQAAWGVVNPTLSTLLDESADRKLCSAIRQVVLETPGVLDAHRIRTRVIGANAVEVNLHITVNKDITVLEGHAIASNVQCAVIRLGVDAQARPVDVMVHVEPGTPVSAYKFTVSESAGDTRIDWKSQADD